MRAHATSWHRLEATPLLFILGGTFLAVVLSQDVGNGATGTSAAATGTVVAWGPSQVAFKSSDYVALGAATHIFFAKRRSGRWEAAGLDTSRLPDLFQLDGAKAVCGGDYYTVALWSSGKVKGWGSRGSVRFQLPAAVTGSNALAVACSENMTAVLVAASGSTRVVMFDGFSSSKKAAVPKSLYGASQIAAGNGFVLALVKGRAVAFGDCSAGVCSVPVAARLTKVTAIAAGTDYCLAASSRTGLVVWGRLPDGLKPLPSYVRKGGAVKQLAAGSFQAVLTNKANKQIWTLGSKLYTQVPGSAQNAQVLQVVANDYGSAALLATSGIPLPYFSPGPSFSPSFFTSPPSLFSSPPDFFSSPPSFFSSPSSFASPSFFTSPPPSLFGGSPPVDPFASPSFFTSPSTGLPPSFFSSPSLFSSPPPSFFQSPSFSYSPSFFTSPPPSFFTSPPPSFFTSPPPTSFQSSPSFFTPQSDPFASPSFFTSSPSLFGSPSFFTPVPALSPSFLGSSPSTSFGPASCGLPTCDDGTGSGLGTAVAGTTGSVTMQVAASPELFVFPGSPTTVEAIFASSRAFFARLTGGTFISAGVGLSSMPPMSALTGAAQVCGGNTWLLARFNDGTLQGWGTLNSVPFTVAASAAVGAADICCSETHALVLKQDGTVVGLGSSTTGATSVPFTLTKAAAIACGYEFSLAVDATSGGVVAWGTPTVNEGQTLVPLTAMSGIKAVSAGKYHAMALTSSGTVLCWGRNKEGQAVPPAFPSAVAGISAGYVHSVAILKSGALVVWGDKRFTSIPATGTSSVIRARANIYGTASLTASSPLFG